MGKTLIITAAVSGAVIAIFCFYLTCQNSYAEQQTPGVVQATKGDPYYFSEGGFGLGILQYFQQPIDPYLTPQTPPNATNSQIMQAYFDATKNITAGAVVSEDNRAKSYVVHFLGNQAEDHVFTSFPRFQALAIKNPITPSGIQTWRFGFVLTSNPSTDKKWFYYNVINDYINPGKVPQPINVNVDLLTGDKTILQTYQYYHCTPIEYVPYLDENLDVLKFHKLFKAEFRERSIFSCAGLHVNFNLRNEKSPSVLSSPSSDNFIPSRNDTVQKYIVTFASDLFGKGITYTSFGKFTPVDKNKINFPKIEDVLQLPANLIGGNPKFALESLPSEDKAKYYQFIDEYINPGVKPEPVDVSIDLVNGDGKTLQTWKYQRCTATDYSVYRQEFVFVWKLKQTFGPEIRDKAIFSCSGLFVDFIQAKPVSYPPLTTVSYVPTDASRAQVFEVRLSGGLFGASHLDYLVPSFQPVSINNPITPPGLNPVRLGFFIETLPNKNQTALYKAVGNYVNPSTELLPFDASIDLKSGDGSSLQTWKYAKCSIVAYVPFREQSLLKHMFTGRFKDEIRDRTIFQCDGLSLQGMKLQANRNETSIDPSSYLPTNSSRVFSFRVTASNGDFKTPLSFQTFADFEPEFTKTGTRYASQIRSSGFTLTDLPSLDKASLAYDLLSRYINPSQKPQPFDMSIDLVTVDGTILQTWKYKDCQLVDYKTNLMDTLLYYTINGRPGISEIQETYQITCDGFSLGFGGHVDVENTIPSNDERAMAYFMTAYGGEQEQYHPTGLVQALDTQNFLDLHNPQQYQIRALSSKYNSNGYTILKQYINPGTKPELFDTTINLLSGNGTTLYSALYKKCDASDYANYLEDNMVNMKFTFSMKSEIRDQVGLNCGGLAVIFLPQRETLGDIYKNFGAVVGSRQLTPLIQQAIGIPGSLTCQDGYQLLMRPPLGNTICIKTSDTSTLLDRGWKVVPPNATKITNKVMPIIPTPEERAMSYKVTFSGAQIKTQTFTTFSDFAPISDSQNAIPSYNPKPSYNLSGQTPTFALWSMPSKDKQPVYNLISQYINPGIKPELFNVNVDIVKGDNSILQTWEFFDCGVTNYEPYYDQNVLLYKFHMKWQAEIKDLATFSCSGFKLKS